MSTKDNAAGIEMTAGMCTEVQCSALNPNISRIFSEKGEFG